MERSLRFAWILAVVVSVCAAPAFAQTSGSLTLAPGFVPDPQRLAGIGGGPVQAQTLNPTCRGWVSQQPNHAITLQAGMQFLRTFVESQTDTTLLIRAPNGQIFCNDDTFGFNPDIDAAYGPGMYLIWVGTYAQGGAAPYSIAFSELRTTMPAPANPGTVPPNGSGGPGVSGSGGSGGGGGGGGSSHATANTGSGGRIFDFHTTTATAVIGQPCVVRSADITVRGRHTFFSDLTVRLRSPSGETETLQSHNQRNPFRRYTSDHFNGTSGTGAWTLSVEDSVGQDGGNLNGFLLNLACQ